MNRAAKVGLSGLAFVALFAVWLDAAVAQAPPAASRDPYVTSTGETVPNPGRSQSGGTTTLDRKIQRENNTIDESILQRVLTTP